MKKKPALGVVIRRTAPVKLYPFRRFFRGFERLACVRAVFGRRTDKILRGLQVEFNSFRWGYMGVNPDDGHLCVSTPYLRNGDLRHVYLDVVHELVHVRQHGEGQELFDEEFAYVDRPTELEAYAVAVAEARRIGLTERELFDYLKTEWMSDAEHRRLAGKVGVRPPR
ncbi:MAG TPA: hypothetical protein DD417_13225 [Elusimicrobia bacterium]|nr:hypothetical protein [Elusimicrobiota bacterium]